MSCTFPRCGCANPATCTRHTQPGTLLRLIATGPVERRGLHLITGWPSHDTEAALRQLRQQGLVCNARIQHRGMLVTTPLGQQQISGGAA